MGTNVEQDETTPRRGMTRMLPLAVILAVALLGGYLLRDYLSFEALRDNRQALLAFRDANYGVTVLAFVAIYVVIPCTLR